MVVDKDKFYAECVRVVIKGRYLSYYVPYLHLHLTHHSYADRVRP